MNSSVAGKGDMLNESQYIPASDDVQVIRK